jgi:hypothetical protein
MAPRLSWIALGVFFIFISGENVLCKKLHLVKKKGMPYHVTGLNVKYSDRLFNYKIVIKKQPAPGV